MQRAAGSTHAPGCLPQNYCTGRGSAEAAGDVQFRIPTTNALLGSVPVHQLCSKIDAAQGMESQTSD